MDVSKKVLQFPGCIVRSLKIDLIKRDRMDAVAPRQLKIDLYQFT